MRILTGSKRWDVRNSRAAPNSRLYAGHMGGPSSKWVVENYIDNPDVDPFKPMSKVTFHRQVAKCRQLFPTNVHVRVSYMAPPTDDLDCGYCVCTLDKDGLIQKVRIWINPKLARVSAIDTLIHEWAHVHQWNNTYPDIDTVKIDKLYSVPDPDHPISFWAIYGAMCSEWMATPPIL